MSSAPFPSSMPSMNIEKFQNSPDERTWKEEFTFIQGADCQFGLFEHYAKKASNWDKEIKLMRDTIRQINAMNPLPKFFVVCGDMLDAFPFGEEAEIRERQYSDFIQIVKDLDPKIPLICCCGNHDVGDNPTRETVAIYRKTFGPDFYSFWCNGVKFVVLNSQYLKVPECVPEETNSQYSFIETIADPTAKHIVVFQHIPFFISSPDEVDEYFNLDKGPRLELLEKLKKSGVRYIFTGHYHRNAGGFYKDIEQVVTSAIGMPLGDAPSGFRIVTVQEDKIIHKYVPVNTEDDSSS